MLLLSLLLPLGLQGADSPAPVVLKRLDEEPIVLPTQPRDHPIRDVAALGCTGPIQQHAMARNHSI